MVPPQRMQKFCCIEVFQVHKFHLGRSVKTLALQQSFQIPLGELYPSSCLYQKLNKKVLSRTVFALPTAPAWLWKMCQLQEKWEGKIQELQSLFYPFASHRKVLQSVIWILAALEILWAELSSKWYDYCNFGKSKKFWGHIQPVESSLPKLDWIGKIPRFSNFCLCL